MRGWAITDVNEHMVRSLPALSFLRANEALCRQLKLCIKFLYISCLTRYCLMYL